MSLRITKFSWLAFVFSVLLCALHTLPSSALSPSVQFNAFNGSSISSVTGNNVTNSVSHIKPTNTSSNANVLELLVTVPNSWKLTKGQYVSVSFNVYRPSNDFQNGFTTNLTSMSMGACNLSAVTAEIEGSNNVMRLTFIGRVGASCTAGGAGITLTSSSLPLIGMNGKDVVAIGGVTVWDPLNLTSNVSVDTSSIVSAINSMNSSITAGLDVLRIQNNDIYNILKDQKTQNNDIWNELHKINGNTANLGGGLNNIDNSINKQSQQQHEDSIKQLEEQQKQTETLEETKDFLTDSTQPDAGDIATDESLPSVGLLPPGPVDSLLNLPISLMKNLLSNFKYNSDHPEYCRPVSLPLPFTNGKKLSLPCLGTLIYSGDFSSVANLVGSVGAALIIFNYFKHLYKKVERATSLETTDEDEWGIL